MKTFRYDGVPVLETTSGKLKGYFYDGQYICSDGIGLNQRFLYTSPLSKGAAENEQTV